MTEPTPSITTNREHMAHLVFDVMADDIATAAILEFKRNGSIDRTTIKDFLSTAYSVIDRDAVLSKRVYAHYADYLKRLENQDKTSEKISRVADVVNELIK